MKGTRMHPQSQGRQHVAHEHGVRSDLISLLREQLPDLRIRVVNVVDLMKRQPDTEHPHGLSDKEDGTITTAQACPTGLARIDGFGMNGERDGHGHSTNLGLDDRRQFAEGRVYFVRSRLLTVTRDRVDRSV